MNLTIGLKDVLLVSPLLALLVFSLGPLLYKVFNKNREAPPVVTLIIALLGIFVAAILLAIFGSGSAFAFMKSLAFDGITLWGGLIALTMMALSLLLVFDSSSTSLKQFSELIFLGLISASGMIVLVAANDLLTIFIGLELMSLPLYIMIAISKEQKLAKEAAFKYFILGSLASAIFLYGVAFVFGASGATLISEIVKQNNELMANSTLYVVGLVLMAIGFCFKVSVFPFHAWTPDVYEGAPTSHTAFMATAVKVVSFLAFTRLALTGAVNTNINANILDLLQWLAVLTITVGNIAACLQDNLKRMLAYSSIAHSGYILIGLLASGLFVESTGAIISNESNLPLSSMIFYFLSYGFMTVGSFAVINILEKHEDHRLNVQDFTGLPKRNPLLAASFMVFMLSLAGLPPTLGFFSKFYVFSAAIEQGLIWLAFIGVLNSVISVYYHLRPVVYMYMKEGESLQVSTGAYVSRISIYLTAFLVITLGLSSGPVLMAIQKSLEAIAQ